MKTYRVPERTCVVFLTRRQASALHNCINEYERAGRKLSKELRIAQGALIGAMKNYDYERGLATRE